MSRHPRCDRFEREGLLLLEQGRPLPRHMLDECPDCVAARQAHEQLRGRLATAGATAAPAVGWQDRVRAQLREAEAGPVPAPGLRPRWHRWALPAFATSAAVVVVVTVGLGFLVYNQNAKQKALEVQDVELQESIDQTLQRIQRSEAEAQQLMARLAAEHDEVKRKALETELELRKLESAAQLRALKLQGAKLMGKGLGGAHLRASGGTKLSGPKGISAKGCDPNDPLCGL